MPLNIDTEGLTREEFLEKVRKITSKITGEEHPDKMSFGTCVKVLQELGVSEDDAREFMALGVASGRLTPIKGEEEPVIIH